MYMFISEQHTVANNGRCGYEPHLANNGGVNIHQNQGVKR